MFCTRTNSIWRGVTCEITACQEWRRLCFVLEGLQATALLLGRCDEARAGEDVPGIPA